MSEKLWEQVLAQIENHGYMTGVDRETSRVLATAEVFTPAALVVDILKRIPLDNFGPGKLVLDPSCGDGQFLAGALAIKVLHFQMSHESALEEIYGVDIMADNVKLARSRLGGGRIFQGNPLNPTERLSGQPEEDYQEVLSILTDSESLTLF